MKKEIINNWAEKCVKGALLMEFMNKYGTDEWDWPEWAQPE